MNKMEILVKTLTGKTISFSVDDITAIEMKCLVCQREGYDIHICLIYAGRYTLKGTNKLSSYGIKDGSYLHMILPNCGGNPRIHQLFRYDVEYHIIDIDHKCPVCPFSSPCVGCKDTGKITLSEGVIIAEKKDSIVIESTGLYPIATSNFQDKNKVYILIRGKHMEIESKVEHVENRYKVHIPLPSINGILVLEGFTNDGTSNGWDLIESIMIPFINVQEECSICIEPIQKGIMCYSCLSIFHVECIKPWFKESSLCPHCRKRISKRDLSHI